MSQNKLDWVLLARFTGFFSVGDSQVTSPFNLHPSEWRRWNAKGIGNGGLLPSPFLSVGTWNENRDRLLEDEKHVVEDLKYEIIERHNNATEPDPFTLLHKMTFEDWERRIRFITYYQWTGSFKMCSQSFLAIGYHCDCILWYKCASEY